MCRHNVRDVIRETAVVMVMKPFFAVYPSDKPLVKETNLSYELQPPVGQRGVSSGGARGLKLCVLS